MLLRDPFYDAATALAASLVPDIDAMYDCIEQAQSRGAEVVVTLFYKPHHHTKQVGAFGLFNRSCASLHNISEIVDPHPNAKGTAAQAAAILEVVG